MPSCVAASITIGGTVTSDDFITLCHHIADQDLSISEDGDAFSPADRTEGEPLRLFDSHAYGGQFAVLEIWCMEHGIPFSRWCAGYPGGWEPERVVFTGTGGIATYPANGKGDVIATRATIDLHDSISTLREWFAEADFEVPPLAILADVAPTVSEITRASAGREESGGGGSEHCSQLEKGSAQ